MVRRIRCRYSFRGVSLLEILVASMVMAMALIPIASIMGVGIKSTVKDFRMIEAIHHLEKTTNMLLQEPYKLIPIGTDVVAYSANTSIPLGPVAGKDATYTVSFTCTEDSSVRFSAWEVNVQSAGFPTNFSVASPLGATHFALAKTDFSFSNCLKRLVVNVRWVEPGSKAKRVVSAYTFRADLNRRGT
ncbi:MAG: hypothetical protein WA705_30705 [Candidatus Ozemobacteraceae bacterium]